MVIDLSLLQTLTPSDQRKFVQFGFGVRDPPPFIRVHDAFEHQALAHPEAIAVDHLGQTITYRDLNIKSSQLAVQLQRMGVVPGSRVCLLVRRSIAMVIGMMAILKAGGAYVPIDGDIVTQHTLEFVLNDSGATLVLSMSDYRDRVCNLPVLCLEDALCLLQDHGSASYKSVQELTPDNSVYVIYTSGTTGQPKGVNVKHSNVTNLVCSSPGNLGMCPGRRVSQLMNIAFDMAAWEILGSLCNGSTICLRGKSFKDWRAVMKTVDIMVATPSMLLRHDPADYPNIKCVAVAGEPCPQALADSWSKTANFYNSCGPTEVTIVNTMQLYDSSQPLSIGRPTPNNNVYILDEDMKPVAIGEPGIMWAGGACVSKGYLKAQKLTAERYKPDPFTNDGSYMFKTGDLGRWQKNGELEPLGRIDDQVKIKGFRVELDGVSAALQACPGVKTAIALLIGTELWGFVTPDTIHEDDVAIAAAKTQPYYAVPAKYMALAELPLTKNGKTDKCALRRLVDEISQPIEENGSEHLSQCSVAASESHDSMPMDLFKSKQSTPPSTSSSITQIAMPEPEKQNAWDGYLEDYVPEKNQPKPVRNLRHLVFTLYRRLFGLVFVTNLAVFIAYLVQGRTSSKELGQIVIANLFCAILMRQDYVINAFFDVFCAVPTSWPLAIRRVCGRVYHIGGLHSGCAISGVVWLILFTVQATRELVRHDGISVATVAVTYIILTLLITMVVFAYPKVRSTHHDLFERVHRFMGWTATVLVWFQVVLLTNDHRRPGQSLGNALVHAPPFWLTCIITVSIILPWLRLRKVSVRSVVMSEHAIRLYFDYVTPVPGTFTRIAKSPLLEWHGFATVPEPGVKGYSLVVSRAGDWTSDVIANPPTHIWVRNIPTAGVLRIVPLFRRLVFVATGSGIGPCAPCILAQRVPIRLLWTAPNVRKTFGDEFVDSILEKSPGAVIYDTRTHGRPDMVKLTYRLVREFNAEAVCVISNQKLTQKVVYGMVSRNIPAFGAIWDS